MTILRQSTAITEKIGPFLDDANGVDAEIALTIQKADVRLSKNGGDMAAATADQGVADAGAPHDELGYYDVSLDATDTNTVGRLKVMIKVADALPVWAEYQVVEEAIYDALFAASAQGFDASQRVNIGRWLDQAVTLSYNNRPDVNVDELSDSLTSPPLLDLFCTVLDGATGQIDAGTFAAGAIDADAVAAGDTGITLQKAMSMLAAFVAGKATVSSVGGVSTITYFERDGATTSFQIAATEADGSRAATGTI